MSEADEVVGDGHVEDTAEDGDGQIAGALALALLVHHGQSRADAGGGDFVQAELAKLFGPKPDVASLDHQCARSLVDLLAEVELGVFREERGAPTVHGPPLGALNQQLALRLACFSEVCRQQRHLGAFLLPVGAFKGDLNVIFAASEPQSTDGLTFTIPHLREWQ